MPTYSDHVRNKAIDWLISQQHVDGAWRSTTYGQMRGGTGNTALIVYSLSHLWSTDRPRARASIDRGVQFLLANLHESGFVRDRDGGSDYPTHATALLLTALNRLEVSQWSDERRRMREYLIASQLIESRGVKRDNIHHGGWDQSGGDPAAPAQGSSSNISVTSLVLEALAASGGVPETTRTAALDYLARLEHIEHDKDSDIPLIGYRFTPRHDDFLNKAGWITDADGKQVARPYGSATADGFTALIACGVEKSDPRRTGALHWMLDHRHSAGVPGFGTVEGTQVEGRDLTMREGLWFYYGFALGRVAREEWSKATAALLHDVRERVREMQRPDGSWQNPSNAMREDEPLIATAFALIALSR